MPFLYEFYLNKEKLSGVEIGFSHSRKWEEALDEAKLSIPFYDSEKPLSQYGLMEITIQEVDNYTDLNVIETETIDMLVVSDRVSTVSQYGVYRHDIAIIEYTAKLDAYIMASLAKTRDIETGLLAKFELVKNVRDINRYNFNKYYGRVWLPPFKVKQKYYTDKLYIFEQVEQAYQSKDLVDVIDTSSQVYSYERRPVIFRYHNIKNNTTSEWFNLSSSDITIEFTETGKYYIEYGVDATQIYDYFKTTPIPAGQYGIYRFYFSVSEYFQQTVYDVIDSVRSNVSKGGGIESEYFFDDTRIFDIDPTLETELKSIQIPQMYLEQATARQMLIFALSYINALPRLEYGEVLDTLKLERFNLSTGDYTRENVYELSGSQNINQIGTRSYAPLNQILPNNMDEPTTYSPSQDGFQQVRADDLQIRDDSFAIKLEKEIYTPKEFLLKVPSIKFYNDFNNINGFDYTGSTTTTLSDVEVSLAERLINIEEWKLKFVTDNFPSVTTFDFYDSNLGLRQNMVENLYWQLGAKKIHLSNVYGQIVNRTLFQNVIKLSIYEYIMLNLPKPFIVTYRPGDVDEQDVMVVGGTNFDIDVDFLDDVQAYKDLRFRFSYLTLENLIVKEEKEDLSQIDFYSEMRQNQDESIVNVIRTSRKNYGNLQRTGNKAFSFQKIHYSLSEQHKIGQVDINKFAITNINRQFFGEYFLAEYFVTKHHNRESRQTIVDQTYRWRDNYTKNVLNRHESYSDYLVFYAPTDTAIFNHTKIYSKENTIYTFLKVLLGETITDFQTRASIALVRTDGMLEYLPENSSADEYHLLTQVSAFPTAKGLAFTFGFDSNQVVGSGLVQRGDNYYNQAVRYTNETGRFSKLSFIIKPKFEIDEDDYENYPRVSKRFRSDIYRESYFWCRLHTLNDVAEDALIIDKDPLTNIKITYQLNAVPYETGEYVLGQALFTYNFLVNNPNSQMKSYLYLYNDNTYYDMFDDSDIKSGYISSTELNGTNIMYSENDDLVAFGGTIDLTGITSWAIGDANGNLYIACNSNHNGFMVKAKHFRPDVSEIGVKTLSEVAYVPTLPESFEILYTIGFDFDVSYRLIEVLKASVDFEDIGFDFDVQYSLLEVFRRSVSFDNIGFNFDISYKLIELTKHSVSFDDIDFNFNVEYVMYQVVYNPEFLEEDTLDLDLVLQDNYSVDLSMVEEDDLNISLIFTEIEIINLAFEEEDSLNITYETTDNTLEPSITFVTARENGALYAFDFSIKNNDSISAEIFADANTTPTTSRGIVASQSYLTVTLVSTASTITAYARAKATGKNYSTVDSATGIFGI